MQLNTKLKVKNNSFKRMPTSQKVVFAIAFILFVCYTATILYTLGWALSSSLRSRPNLRNTPFAWPELPLQFKNYTLAFTKMEEVLGPGNNMLKLMFNSLWYSAFGTLIQISCATTLAYVVSKYKFWGRNAIYFIAIVVMTLPIIGSLPASYKLIMELGIDNSPLILLTFTSGFGFNFIVLYGFFANVSWSYAEAGLIDGAGDFTIFLRIMLPQAVPAILSLYILAFIGVWNDYMGPLLYMKDMPTLAVGIFRYDEESKGNPHILYAAIVISLIPIIILFLSFQETIMSNTVPSGLKG